MVTTVTDNSPQSINTSLFSLDKEVQEIKKVTDKLSGINPEANVISVNGKQGIVELTASDVKALPSSTVIPTTTSELENTSGFITIEDVAEGYVPLTRTINDKPLTSDITLTASDVGSLPDTTVIPSKTSELTNDSGFITESSDITGNAETATTADKVKNALTVNGKTYDGSSAVDAGVQTVENGGTGVTTQADINKAFIGNLDTGESDVTDGTEFVSSYASDNSFSEPGYVNTPFRRKFSAVWNYIKGKISSVLGLTANNYGGTAATILDYNRNTPIKVRWGGPGIDSAEWYPAFSADGSAIEPINRNNIHAGTADYARNMYYQNLDLSALDKTKFYPLVCWSGNDFAEVAIFSGGGMASAEYNQNRIHFDISTQGWSDLPPTLNIREYTCYENNEITIGCIGRGLHNGAWAIWLRGGLHYVCFSRNADLSLHTSDYTFGDETYTVGTNYYGGSNTNVGAWFTPQYTITEGAYSNRPINAPNITSLEQRVAALESRL